MARVSGTGPAGVHLYVGLRRHVARRMLAQSKRARRSATTSAAEAKAAYASRRRTPIADEQRRRKAWGDLWGAHAIESARQTRDGG